MATTYTINSEVSFAAITYLFGNLFAVSFGSALIIACAFYLSSTSDRPIFRRSVSALLVFEILHVVLAFADTARTFGDGFGNVDRVYALSPIYVAGMIIGGCTAALVQSFYAWRCYRLLGNHIILPIVLGIFILFGLGCVFAGNLIAYTSEDAGIYMTNGPTLQAFIYMRLPYIAAIAIDTMLCTLTLYALYKAQAMGSAQGVGTVVKRLSLLTISSFALTTTYCTMLLIFSVTYSGAFWALTLPGMDFYVLTLLVWLYQRRSEPESRRGSHNPSGSGSSGASDSPLRPTHAASSFGSPGKPRRVTEGIRIHSSTIVASSEPKNDSDIESFDNAKSLQ